MLLADLEDELREEEARLARIRQDIKAKETTLTHEDALTADLETEWATTRRRTNELTGRVRSLGAALTETAHELAGITAALYTGQSGPQRTRVSSDGLITDRPDLARKLLEARGQRWR